MRDAPDLKDPSVSIPLSWRAPNPPSPFIGRDDDVVRLLGVLQRSAVAVVWGFSGVGKSALVQAAVQAAVQGANDTDRDADRHARTLWLRASGDVMATLQERVQGLGVAPHGELLEAIEHLGLQVIVDGIERLADVPGLLELARLLARHGRRGRLIVVCREDPRDVELSTRTLRIAPLSDDALAALVDAVVPGRPPSVRRSLAVAAAGSPWRLLQLGLDGDGDGSAAAGPDASLLALSPVARGLLATLTLVDEGLPREVLARATRLPDDDAIRALVRRGWIETVGGALHLHHAARPIVALGVSAEERRRRRQRLGEALHDPASAPDVRRLLPGLIGDILADEGPVIAAPLVERLVLLATATADSERLQRLVDGTGVTGRTPELEVALIALGLEVGDAALARLPLPADRDDDDGAVVLARARLALARGEGPRARSGLLAALARPDLEDALLAPALALAADRGDLDVVAVIGARSAWLRPIAAALQGHHLEAAVAALGVLEDTARRVLGAPVARALLAAGRVGDARAVLGGGTTAAAAALLEARAVAVTSDDADGEWAAALASPHLLQRLEARLWHGVDRLRRTDDDLAHHDLLASLGEALPATSAPPRLRAILTALRAATADEGNARRSADPDVTVLLDELQRGDPATVHSAATRARARARAGGDRLRALELGMLVIDAALVARAAGHATADGGDDDARAVWTTLLAEARALRVPCLVDELRVIGMLLEHPSTATARDEATLAALAQSPARRAARRARALLGEDVVVGTWDRLVLQRGLQQTTRAAVVVQGTGDREWVVDEARRQIVCGSDVVVDLSDKAILLGLLVTLLRHGGHATKEQLLVEVWAVREYHPLHHDNRLKVAVRKLRRLLEEVLGDDPIEAGDDGYRLRGRVRFVSA